MISSYLVRGRTIRSLSKAPYSQLIATGISGGRFMWAILGMEPAFSMYAAFTPVPKIQPIFISESVYEEAIRVPVVSLIRAATLMGSPYSN